MRNNAVKILMMLTGALMLVLSVLPHHHHGDVIHFGVVERCETCQDCGKAAPQGLLDAIAHKHSHSEESDAHCDLRQLFVISAREEQLLPTCSCDHDGDHLAFDHFSLTLLHQSSLPLAHSEPDGTPLEFPPLIQPLGSLLGGHIFALRAPPVVIA